MVRYVIHESSEEENMIKKLLTTTAVLLTAGVAHADGVFDNTRYSLGGEMSVLNSTQYTTANTPDLNNFRASNSDSKLVIRKNRPGFSFYAQARFNPFIALEAGYSIILKVTGTAQGGHEATNKISTPYLDLLGFMPVAERVDLIGSFGFGYMKSNANVSDVSFQDLSALTSPKVNYRFGLGAAFTLTNNWATRVMLRYQSGSNAFLRSNTSLALGLQYTF